MTTLASTMRLCDLQAPHRLGYRPALDGLRAVAVGLVVVFHFGVPGSDGGFLGVDIFFTLSGFLITTLLVEEIGRTSRLDLRDFYVRRMYRLMPSLVAMLLAVTALMIVIGTAEQFANFGKNALATLVYANNIPRAMYTDWDGPTLGHVWSLAIEEQFYLVWPAALLLMRKWPVRRVLATLALLIIAVACWRAHLQWNGTMTERIYVGTDTRADQLLIGAAAAIYRLRGLGPHVRRAVHAAVTPWLCSAIITACVLAQPRPDKAAWWLPFGIPVFELSVTLLLLCIVDGRPGKIATALATKPFLAVGRISYELYLVHVPIAFFVLARQRGILPNDYVYVIVWTIVSLGVAFAINRFIARPIQRLRHRSLPYITSEQASKAARPTPARPTPAGSAMNASATLDHL